MSSRCTERAFDRAAGRKWRAAAPSMPFDQQFQLIFAGRTSSGTAAARREAASASNSAAANVSYSAAAADRPSASYAAAAAP